MKLVGDIGGTNVRFALVDDQRHLLEVKDFKRADFEDVTSALLAYLSVVTVKPKEALLAVNTTVIRGEPIKNRNYWGYLEDKLLAKTKLEKISYINDGVAHAMAVPFLLDNEKIKVIEGDIQDRGTLLVLGIGTEIGTSIGVYNDELHKYVFQPSESGFQFVSPVSVPQTRLINKILKKEGPIKWNNIASGSGIAKIYNTLNESSKKASEIMKDYHSGDKKAQKAFGLFCEFLGVFVRNMAFTTLPTGGIYLTGGILSRPENQLALQQSRFLEFYQLGVPQVSGLRGIPVFVSNIGDSALRGLAQN